MKYITEEMLNEMISNKEQRIKALEGYVTKAKWLSQTKLSEARKYSIELRQIKSEIVLLTDLITEVNSN